MSGHSKWHSIRHKKGAADAKRAKIFTRHGHLITIAARGGGDPEMNASLRLAIDNAKKENVPNANIEKAIKKGTGELKDGAEIEEVTYEGYGPEGVAIIVECLTDNKNRSFTNVRTIFNKRGGSLGNSGSVSWMFDRKGLIQIKTDGVDLDEAELAAIDAGAEDVQRDDEQLEIFTEATSLNAVSEKLRATGYEIQKAELQLIPNQTVRIEDEKSAQNILDFIDALDEDPDVNQISANFDFPEGLIEKLEMA